MNDRVKVRHKPRRHQFSKMRRIFLFFLLLIGCITFLTLYQILTTEKADTWFESEAIENLPVLLPKDDGPHPDATLESWHFTGHLKSESKNLYSFFYTVSLSNNLVSYMISHAALNDHQTDKHYIAQQKNIGNSSVSSENRFEFTQGDWHLKGGKGETRIKVSTSNYSYDLQLQDTRPPIFHGKNGIVRLDGANKSYYYTRSRMAISGTIMIGETTEKVTGVSWFDHQWSDNPIDISLYDWFNLQLNDGTDIMIYQFRDKFNKPKYRLASIYHNGVVETLTKEDLLMVPESEWTSSNTNISYPIEWTVTIPKKKITLKIKSTNKNNEIDAALTNYKIYWKGPVSVYGSHTGLGFMKLNYLTNNQSKLEAEISEP